MTGARYLCAIAGLGITFSAQAEPFTTNFESLAHGEIIDTQFADLGVSLSAVNFEFVGAMPVAFNSNLRGTADPDLEGPNWAKGNIAPGTDLGNLIIITENVTDANGDGIVDNPDDEGARPAGQLIFGFDDVMTGFGFDLVDMEGPVREMSSLEFLLFGQLVATVDFNQFVTPGNPFYDPTVRFGNNSANRISVITSEALGISGFTSVVINVGGSGGYDNIVVVPATGAPAVLAGLGLVLARRRRA